MIETIENPRIQDMLLTVLSMYEDYDFFTAPGIPALDEISDSYEASYKKFIKEERASYSDFTDISTSEIYQYWLNYRIN